MTKEEGQVSEFIGLFHRICLEERDFERLSCMIAEEIEWTGAGTRGACRGRDTSLKLLEKDFPRRDCSYHIIRSEYHVSKSAAHFYLFSGYCYISRTRDGEVFREYELRVSGACSFDETAPPFPAGQDVGSRSAAGIR